MPKTRTWSNLNTCWSEAEHEAAGKLSAEALVKKLTRNITSIKKVHVPKRGETPNESTLLTVYEWEVRQRVRPENPESEATIAAWDRFGPRGHVQTNSKVIRRRKEARIAKESVPPETPRSLAPMSATINRVTGSGALDVRKALRPSETMLTKLTPVAVELANTSDPFGMMLGAMFSIYTTLAGKAESIGDQKLFSAIASQYLAAQDLPRTAS